MLQVIKKIAVRTFLVVVILVVVVVVGTLLALQTSPVQTWLAGKATDWVSQKIGFPVSIGKVDVHWVDHASFRDVVIEDAEHNRMIDVPELDVDFHFTTLLQGRDISIDDVLLDGARVRLVKSRKTNTLNIDDFIAAVNNLTAGGDTTRSRRPPVFSIDRVTLSNVQFSYNDQRKDSITDGFDYQHFTVDSINGSASNFRLVADTIELDIKKLSGVHPQTRLGVHKLQAFFRYTRHQMQLTSLHARVGDSYIADSLVFRYERAADLGEFNDKVTILAHLDKTRIYSKDLALFAPYLNRYEEYWFVTGDFNGKVTRFRLRNADLAFGRRSAIRGNVSFTGLPDFNNTFIDFDLRPSVIVAGDLKQYAPGEEAYGTIKKFGTVRLRGKFLGFPKDFVANGSFDTDLGRVVSDINLKIRDNPAKSSYKGRLMTTGFDVGTLSGRPELVQRLDVNGRVEGTGFSAETATLRVNATARRIGVRGYDYRNITMNGKLSRQQFSGALVVNDTNLVVSAEGDVDLRNGQRLINVRANLQKADLQALNLTERQAVVSTRVDLNVQGLAQDDITGEAHLTGLYVMLGNRDIRLDTLYVSSHKGGGPEGLRDFSLHSELAEVKASGNFQYRQLLADVQRLVGEYKLNFINDDAQTRAYYRQKVVEPHQRYRLAYQVALKDINPVLALFGSGLYVSKNTFVEGDFSTGKTSIARLNTRIDTLVWQNYRFYGNEVDISTSKLADSSDVLAATYLYSARQQFGTAPATDTLRLEAVWGGPKIDFEGTITQVDNANRADLLGELQFLPGLIQVQFRPSQFRVLDNTWRINAENLITVRGREVTFANLAVANNYQMITLDGAVSDTASRGVQLTLRDFDLRTLNPLTGHDLRGIANGFVNVKDLYRRLNLQSELNIEELVLDKFLIGDIEGKSYWDNTDQRVHVNYQVYRQDMPTLNLTGTYNQADDESPLDLKARLNQAHIDILEPFLQGLFNKLAGTATGELSITGKPAAPVVMGNLMVRSGKFRFDYLNTTYHFEDRVYFTENEIGFKNLRLYDDENSTAIVNGGIYHDGFREFGLSMDADLRNFKVMNTTFRDNDLFYGTAVVTGTLSLLGPAENLVIRANARSEKGTRIAIPVSENKEVGQADYIRFVDKKSRAARDSSLVAKNVDLSGIRLDFNFDITPDAYCEIIFDQVTGDIIRGNGTGKVKMLIDTKGDFTMFGDYTINKGFYNFTLLNAVNKEFAIEPGGTVTWSGDPYGGRLDIEATYEQSVSMLPLVLNELREESKNNAEFNRLYPVNVLLRLTGNLLNPDIHLGINFKDYPRNSPVIRNAVLDFENRITTDEQEMNRQVFSLLILRQLSPPGNFSGVGGSVTNSLSEMLANQLSYWASQLDKNLEVNLNLNGISPEAFNTFQLRLSYSLFEGRLRVTRAGGFTNAQNDPTAQSIIGDWTVEYILSRDGALRVKMFNRNSQNLVNAQMSSGTLNTVAGFSLLHTKSFDSLLGLFGKNPDVEIPVEEEKKEEPKRRKEEEPQQLQEPATKATSILNFKKGRQRP